ncbi:hypothetical protein EVAR_61051_1 [Eumeta japonica]|uniref:Uncharacterized protein n=1 Tax=Eumeta variegata TaxID=151549 RepID=A0A4C1Z3T9_EUMVA|nr:hypothetical protein EVAR_61051_1 [Eumeta japonica]
MVVFEGKTINSDLYCQQLMRLKPEVEKKRPDSMNRKVIHNARDGKSVNKSLERRCLEVIEENIHMAATVAANRTRDGNR